MAQNQTKTKKEKILKLIKAINASPRRLKRGLYPLEPSDEEICKGVEEITEKRIKKIDQGTTIWFLVPNQ